MTLLPRTALTVETSRNGSLLTGYFADPAPTRRVALAMRTGAARAAEYTELAAALGKRCGHCRSVSCGAERG